MVEETSNAAVPINSTNRENTNSEVAQNETAVEQGEAQPQAQQPRPSMFSMIKTLLVRMAIIYMIASLFRRSPTPTTGKDGGPPPAPSSNVFQKDDALDMYVYVSEDEKFSSFDDAPFWFQKGLVYGDWVSGPDSDGCFSKHGEIVASEALMNNGSIFLHVFFVRVGKSPNPKNKSQYVKKETVYRYRQLNKFKKRKFHQTVNLLTGTTDVHPDLIKKTNSSDFEILSHWHPNLTINLIDDHTPWVKGSVPPPLDEYVDFLPGSKKYLPILYFNDYWNLNNEYMPINDTTKVLNLTLSYNPISLFRWQMYAAQSMRNKWYQQFSMIGGGMEESDEEQDSLKVTFLETNPYLLALTVVVSIVHSVFEFLAFKNDIQFWKNRKSLEGLSVRSVFFNVFQSAIVLLYICDNETNTVVKISVFVGLCIEIWKIFKVVNVEIDRSRKLLGVIPYVVIQDKSTYTESHTKAYDQLAFKYLSWLLFPLLGGYSIYSLLYLEHKGWYSWVLGMLYGFLLTFGFIMMTPQLFINYKLKSVAHLPWRMLTYKALNTFIDDMFAFVIKMPTLYRIGCFRDDIVFFIFLYQRWIYRIDPKRVNEYGTSQEMFEQNGTLAIPQDDANEADNSANNIPVKTDDEKKKD